MRQTINKCLSLYCTPSIYTAHTLYRVVLKLLNMFVKSETQIFCQYSSTCDSSNACRFLTHQQLNAPLFSLIRKLKANCPQKKFSLSVTALISKSMNKLVFIQSNYSMMNLQPIISWSLSSFKKIINSFQRISYGAIEICLWFIWTLYKYFDIYMGIFTTVFTRSELETVCL